MMHNKEFRSITLAYLLLFLVFFIPTLIHSLFFASLLMVMFLLFYVLFYGFTRKRYRHIQELSTYLQAVYNGLETMDIRDHEEGELSILKSDLYKITSILRQQADTLQKDKMFLADALSNISHQLRTPLTSMFVMSDLLQDEQLPKEKRIMFTTQLQQQVKRLEWLVSALLKMSRIDARAIDFHREPVQISSILHKATLPFLIPMELKEQMLYICCDDHISLSLDENWTIEALVNIIKNCMEHTPIKGTITLSCEENPLHTIIRISDTGCGIDKEDMSHIFEQFYKGKNASNESAGIGLALTKSILREQQAAIEVRNNEECGVTFTICFYK